MHDKGCNHGSMAQHKKDYLRGYTAWIQRDTVHSLPWCLVCLVTGDQFLIDGQFFCMF